MTGQLPDLRTGRLLLRGLQPGDEAFLSMLDSDALVMKHIHTGPLKCSDAATWASLQVESYSICWKQTGKWMAELRTTPTRIGWVEVAKLRLKERRCYSIGYEFAPAFWGCGYASEAVARVVDDLFERLDEYSAFAYVRPDNERSIRLLQRLGFRFTGWHFADGGRHRCDVYRVSRQEWPGRAEVRPGSPVLI
jgi:ribosomal-protein-alanine N-acetyltransferase